MENAERVVASGLSIPLANPGGSDMARAIQNDRYLHSTYQMIQHAFDTMLPAIIGKHRYYHMTSESSRAAAQQRVDACHQLGYRAVMRRSGPYLVKGQGGARWVVFVAKPAGKKERKRW